MSLTVQIIAFDKPLTDNVADLVLIGTVGLTWLDDADLVRALGANRFKTDEPVLLGCDSHGMWLCLQGKALYCFEDQPKMRSLVLCFVGEMLHGAEWHSALAADLCMGSRSIRYFASGERYPSEGIICDALTLCADRVQKLQPLAEAGLLVRRPC